MSKILDIVGHPVDSNSIKIELILDNQTYYYHTVHPTGVESRNKALNVIKRLIKPHLSGLLLKHITHLDKLVSEVLDIGAGHTGGYNLSFAVSVLLWEAFAKEQEMSLVSVLEQYNLPPSEKIPSYIFSIFQPLADEKIGLFSEFMIIVRRNTEYTAAHKMYTKIHESLSKIHAVNNVDIIELIINKIKENNYLYNNDIFLGVRADLEKTDNSLYRVPDILEDLDEVKLIEYFNKIVETYDPLIIENPLLEYESNFYEKLENSVGKNSLIGITANPQNMSGNTLKRVISNRRISVCVLDTDKLSSLTQLCELSQLCHDSKVKFVIATSDSKNEVVKETITKLNPEFIKYRIKNK